MASKWLKYTAWTIVILTILYSIYQILFCSPSCHHYQIDYDIAGNVLLFPWMLLDGLISPCSKEEEILSACQNTPTGWYFVIGVCIMLLIIYRIKECQDSREKEEDEKTKKEIEEIEKSIRENMEEDKKKN